MRTAAAQLRASSMGGRERLFRDATPIGISIMVEVDQETYNTLDVAPLNNLMAAAVDRATDFALNKADALGSDGCFTARLSKVTDPVQGLHRHDHQSTVTHLTFPSYGHQEKMARRSVQSNRFSLSRSGGHFLLKKLVD
jgi:hypothetical protein